ncbi:AAA family ATPase [Massilia sp. H-1]|nr:AAA family ATPase [Massilia sp. H-1]
MPGQLVGVVGPNGCGKSNIIDAVRWVLGESKASGIARRVDAGRDLQRLDPPQAGCRASVELVFDNNDGKAMPSQWGQYAEIAVKRTLTRDGTSTYYINGQPVRWQGHPGHLPRHRPGTARLRDHRPGHDLAHHRIAPGRAARIPRRGGRCLQVQGTPAQGNGKPPQRHARTCCAWKTSCAN